MPNTIIKNIRKRSTSEILQLSLVYTVISIFSLLMIGPFLWSLLTSVIPDANLYDMDIDLAKLTGENYVRLFRDTEIFRWFMNTMIVTVGIVAMVIFLSVLGGYVFATRNFPGKKLLFSLVLLFLMVPVQVVLIPMFLEMKFLHVTDSYLGLILPYSGSAFGVFLITQYMKTIPPSLIESAKIDGASEFRIIFQILMPLCIPALATLSIIKFNFAWNDFIWPLIIIRSPEMRTLPLGIALMFGRSSADWSLVMSSVIVSTTPVILLTLFLQKYFVRGVATSGLK